jgi:hypothetical protein
MQAFITARHDGAPPSPGSSDRTRPHADTAIPARHCNGDEDDHYQHHQNPARSSGSCTRRNDYVAWPIHSGKLNIGTATPTTKELIRKGLVVEKPASDKAPVWWQDDDGRSLMAAISEDGLAASGVLPAGKRADRPPLILESRTVTCASALLVQLGLEPK